VQAQRARENAFKDYQSLQERGGNTRTPTQIREPVEQERIARTNAELIIKQPVTNGSQPIIAINSAVCAQKAVLGPDETQIAQAELQIAQAELNLERLATI
jgi:multidrug resistance efflux pump